MYSMPMMAGNKRSFIEVGPPPENLYSKNCDPLQLFASMLKDKYGGTENTENTNYKLLKDLIKRGKVSKSSIIWHNDTISRIYGFKIDHNGEIEYDISGNQSPEKPKPKSKLYVTNAPPIDMSALRNAIIRSKQIAI